MIHFPPPAALVMSHEFTLAMIDHMPKRDPSVPLDLRLPTPGARLAMADQQRIAAAMAEVMNRRVRQIEKGFTIHHDMVLGERDLLRKVGQLLTAVREDCARGTINRRDAMIHASEAAAVLLAFVEVQHERMAQEASEQASEPEQEQA